MGYASQDWLGSAELHGRNDTGHDRLPRVDRQWMGDPLSPPEGFYVGLHEGARLYGRADARVPKAQRKIIGLSVGPVSDHVHWAKDIEETQGHAINYPMTGDPELKVAKLYDVLPEGAGDSSAAVLRLTTPRSTRSS
jgi:AhpC/TSA family